MAIQVRPDTAGFERRGPARWQPNGWELDRLTVPYQGPAAKLDAFITGLTLWSASDIDANMFLEDWTNDEDPVHPTVSLVYIGKKGGVLPPDRNAAGYTVQQARYNVFQFVGGSGSFYIQLTYTAPTSSKVTWGRTPIDVGTIGAITPVAATVVWWLSEWINFTPIPLPISEGSVLSFFLQRESITGDSEELVPGQYYRGTQTKQNLLFSVEG